MKITVNDVNLTFNCHNQYKYNTATHRNDYCRVFEAPCVAIYCNKRYLATVELDNLIEWCCKFTRQYRGPGYTFNVYPRKSVNTRKRRWFADWHGCHLLDLDTGEVLYERNFDTDKEYISQEFKRNLYYWRKVAKEYKRIYVFTTTKEDK